MAAESLVEEVLDVVGDEFPEEDVRLALEQAGHDVDEAIGILYRGTLNRSLCGGSGETQTQETREAMKLDVDETKDMQVPEQTVQSSPMNHSYPDERNRIDEGKKVEEALSHKVQPKLYSATPSKLASVVCKDDRVDEVVSTILAHKLSIISIDRDSSVKPFAFDTPSPDEIIIEMQQRRFKRAPQKPVSSGTSTKLLNDPEFTKKPEMTDEKNEPLNVRDQPMKVVKFVKKPTPGQEQNLKTNTNIPKKEKIVPQRSVARNREIANILKEFGREKSSKSVVFCGESGSGKTTLISQIMCAYGHVTQQQLHKAKADAEKAGRKDSQLAWIIDDINYERKQGGTASTSIRNIELNSNSSIQLIDVPGCGSFYHELVSGCSQADVFVFVASSDYLQKEAESQFIVKEQLMLLRSFGVSKLVVLLNKMDKVEWKEGYFQKLKDVLSVIISQSGFRSTQVQFIPCSGLYGTCINDVREISWYKGDSIIKTICDSFPIHTTSDKPFRLSIYDVYRNASSNTVVCGKVLSGNIAVGDNLFLSAAKELVAVKGLSSQSQIGQVENVSMTGEWVEMILANANLTNIRIGDVLCDPENLVPTATVFVCRVVVANPYLLLTKGSLALCCCRNQVESVTIKKITAPLEKNHCDKATKSLRYATSGQNVDVVVEVESAGMCVEEFSKSKDFGRISLLSNERIAAVGIVLARIS